MCNCSWSQPYIVNKNCRDLTEKSFKTRAGVVEAAKRAEASVRLYEISKRVKKGTHDTDIRDNQTTSTALAPLSDGEKNHIQELYRMIETESGNSKFDLFWRRLRNCFGKDDSYAHNKVIHHRMVVSEKLAGKYATTIDKRTQHTGKVGPEERKREDDNPESTADDKRSVTIKRFNGLFSLKEQMVKITNSQKENQGQGCRGDSVLRRDPCPCKLYIH